MKRCIFFLVSIIILAFPVTAQIEFNDSSDIQFRTGLDMNSNSISGVPSPSSSDHAVPKSYVDAFDGSQGLPSVLEINSTANQTIDMDGNRILNAGYINAEGDINLTGSGDPVLDYKAYEGPKYGAFLRYDSQFGGDTNDNRIVLGTENNNNEYLVLTAEREGSGLNLHRDVKMVDSDNFVIEQPNDPRVNVTLQENEERGAFFRYDSNFNGDTTDNRAVLGTKDSGTEYVILTADRDGDWVDMERPFHDSIEVRRPASGDPVLNYRLQEGNDYGAHVRYDSNYSGDDTDNRLVIGTEDSGNDYEVLSAERAGSWAKIHRDTNISGDLYVDGSISGVSASGLSEVLEVNNTANQSIVMIEGVVIGGSSTSAGSEDGVALGPGANTVVSGSDSNGSIAIGLDSYAESNSGSGNSATALGRNAYAYGYGSTALGKGSNASANNAVALGRMTEALSAGTAVGDLAYANGDAVALGNGANGGGTDSVALGLDADASAYDTIAIGQGATANNIHSTAIQENAVTNGNDAIAIGRQSAGNSGNAVAVGRSSLAGGSGGAQVALGYNSNASGDASTALGFGTAADGNGAVSIGRSASSTGSGVAIGRGADENDGNGVALGYNSNAASWNTVSIGEESQSWDSAVALGKQASGWSYRGIAIGDNSNVTGGNGIAIGALANSGGDVDGIAIGRNTTAINASIAIGGITVPSYAPNTSLETEALGEVSMALAPGAQATADNAYALGIASESSGQASSAIGMMSNASADRALAIGSEAEATAYNAVAIGESALAPNTDEATFGNLNGDEMDVNVTGNLKTHGTVSADQAELRQPQSGQPVLSYRMQEGDDYGAYLEYDSQFGGDTGDNRLVIGTEDSGTDYEVLSAERAGSWAKIHRDTNISGDLYVDGSLTGVSTGGSASGLSEVLEVNNTANQSIEFSTNNVVIGDENTVASSDSNANQVIIGKGAKAQNTIGYDDTAVGNGANVDPYGTSIGANSNTDNEAVALGKDADASGNGAIAIGGNAASSGTTASGSESVSLGYGATSSANGAVALGHNSDATNAYEATFGNLQGQELDLNVTGNATIHENLEVYGGTKNFVEGLNETHEIVYTSSESGEAVVEWSDSVNVGGEGTEVTLPDHLQEVMSSEEDYHVLTTPVNSLANTGVFDKTDSGFTLKASEDTEVDFHVRGVRAGFEDKEVVREK